MDLLNYVLEVINAIIKHGWSPLALIAATTALFRVRKIRKRINRLFPWLSEDESEIKPYINNQLIIMENQRRMMAQMGIEPCGVLETGMTGQTSLKRSSVSSQAVKYTVNLLRRTKKMKTYLKKLGKTKFQALLVSLIVNIASAVLFMTGHLDIDNVVNTWMPIINMTVATISTWVYILVEGSIDKANVQGGNNDVNQNDYH